MTIVYTCDVCGEPIGHKEDHVELVQKIQPVVNRSGYTHGYIGHFHASPGRDCYGRVYDAVQAQRGQEEGPTPEDPEEERRRRYYAWTSAPRDTRERLVLEAIGARRLTLGQLLKRIMDAHGEDYLLHSSNLRYVVVRMVEAGELDRIGEQHHGHLRYRYFRRTDLRGPIADLDQQLNEGG